MGYIRTYLLLSKIRSYLQQDGCIYLSTYVATYRYLSMHLSIYPYLPFYLPIDLSIHLSISFIYLSICLSMCIHVYIYIHICLPPQDPQLLCFEASVAKLPRTFIFSNFQRYSPKALDFQISSPKALDFQISKFPDFRPPGPRFLNCQSEP